MSENNHITPEQEEGGKPRIQRGLRTWLFGPRRVEIILALIPTILAAVYCLLAFIFPPREDVPDLIQWPEGIAPGTTTPVVEASARHSLPSLVALYWPEILVCCVTLVCLTIYAVVMLRARVRRRLTTGNLIQISGGGS